MFYTTNAVATHTRLFFYSAVNCLHAQLCAGPITNQQNAAASMNEMMGTALSSAVFDLTKVT